MIIENRLVKYFHHREYREDIMIFFIENININHMLFNP